MNMHNAHARACDLIQKNVIDKDIDKNENTHKGAW